MTDLEVAVRYAIEVAKAFTAGSLAFYDEVEWQKLTGLYGSLGHLQVVQS